MLEKAMVDKKQLTAQDLYNYVRCPHRVYLDSNGDPKEKSEVNLFLKLLWEKGLQTEREYLQTISDHEVIDLSNKGVKEAWPQTQRSMKKGGELIYQACLSHGTYLGRPDLLLKHTDASSTFGSYYYEPIDIKAGRGWERRQDKYSKFKKHYAFQILFYQMLLGSIQGYIPPTGHIINVEKEIEEFDPLIFKGEFSSAVAQAQKLIQGEETSESVLSSHCFQCEWFKHCRTWVDKTSDPTAIFFVGKNKFRLKEVGLKKVRDLAKMDISKYLEPPLKIHGLGKKSLARIKQRAQVVLKGRPLIRKGYSFPEAPVEIYFDVEDDPTRGLVYLFGLLIKEDGDLRYRYFLARRPEEEEATVRQFWGFLKNTDGAVYYVYSHKERSTLKHLQAKYELNEEAFQKYKLSEFDLYSQLIVVYSDWPTFSYGIKYIARWIGFRWRDPDPSGVNSIVWYNEYLKDPTDEGKLQRILQYNEDDCQAMVVLKEYFEKRAEANEHRT